MTDSGEESSHTSSVSRDDEEIYCAFCHYNLTGNLTGRCPECGSMFDCEILLQANGRSCCWVAIFYGE